MLPFAGFLGSPGGDASDPSTWTTTVPSGGTSTVDRANRSWTGKGPSGQGSAELVLPFTAVVGSLYRLSFTLTGSNVSVSCFDASGASVFFQSGIPAGARQCDVRAASAGAFKFDIATAGTSTATGIRVELLN